MNRSDIDTSESNSSFVAGSALRLPPHSDVVFHLRDHRYAGTYLSVGGITSAFVAHARDYFVSFSFFFFFFFFFFFVNSRPSNYHADTTAEFRPRVSNARRVEKCADIGVSSVRGYRLRATTIYRSEMLNRCSCVCVCVWSQLVIMKFRCQVFGNISNDPGTAIDDHNNFQSFFAGLMLLFRWVEQLNGASFEVGLKWTFVDEKATDPSRDFICLE